MVNQERIRLHGWIKARPFVERMEEVLTGVATPTGDDTPFPRTGRFVTLKPLERVPFKVEPRVPLRIEGISI